MNERCVGCTRPMIRGGRKPPLGIVRHYAHGKCTSCSRPSRARYVPCGRPLTYRNPAGDIDDVVVQRLIAGDLTVRCTNGEMREAILALNNAGLTARRVAERLGITMRTVTRHRTAMRAAA